MTTSDENLTSRHNGRRYDDLKAGGGRYLFGGLQVVVIMMLAWGGANVIDNGKALARVETKMIGYAKQTDSMENRHDRLSDRILTLEKDPR